MKKINKSVLLAILGGTVLSGIITLLAFMIMDQEQCPLSYTQAQVDASNCVVGANIGLGIFALFLPFIWFLCFVASFALLRTLQQKKRS